MQRMAMETDRREYRYPNNTQTTYSYQSFDYTMNTVPGTDMVIYDGLTGNYRISQQDRKIRELEQELEEKKRQEESTKKEEEESLKKLIAYYFNR